MGQGMGMGAGFAMAQQMGNMFNQQNQQQPPQAAPAAAPPPPPPPPQEVTYHVAENGQTLGPYSVAQLSQMAQSGQLKKDTLVWANGMAGWTAAGEVAGLTRVFGAMPPPPPPPRRRRRY